jgi:hypothetical protein
MSNDDRDRIVELGKRKTDLRTSLASDLDQARHDLHPKTIARRWTNRKRAQIADIAESGKKGLKKNAPLIGLASSAILLFAARKPISAAIRRLREKAHKAKDQNL